MDRGDGCTAISVLNTTLRYKPKMVNFVMSI